MTRAGPFADRESIKRCQSFVLSIVCHFGVPMSEADDAAQAVLLAAFVRRHDYERSKGTLEAWLTGITRRIASNWRRGLERRPAILLEPDAFDIMSADERSPEEAAEHREIVSFCRRALSPEKWRAFVACAVEGVTLEAFAEQEGITKGALEWRLHVARRELRAALLLRRTTLGHADGCVCWRCAERRGEDDPLAPFRPRQVDPTECPHPDDAKMPVSGDGWLCGYCGADVERPPGVTALERVFELADELSREDP